MNEENEAFTAGYTAYQDGKMELDNPHPFETDQFTDWADGFETAAFEELGE